ncbi:peptidoglycan bridge formation glycyltransferase FemA/FemB family protein [bacterium]|nr:peptidoglycan bridge formation glycyltransferase FemA/FemB family protein [bacterium]
MMQFDWTLRPESEWRELCKKVPRLNMLQSLPFERAAWMLDKKLTRRAVITIDNEPAGIMAIQEIHLGPIHVIDLYRGPLWFSANPPESWLLDFARLFNETWPRRLLRRRRWLPEWPDGETARKVLGGLGFRLLPKSFETVWMDLSLPENEIRANMNPKWRGHLNKGERCNLEIIEDWTGSTGKAFLRQYDVDKSIKKYYGRSPRFIAAELALALRSREAVFLWACENKIPVAAILVVMHGHSATYRIGWTTDEGRKANGHNVLLWEAVRRLKAKGYAWFDLGGIEPHGAEGLTTFKTGMGGDVLKLMGVFN